MLRYLLGTRSGIFELAEAKKEKEEIKNLPQGDERRRRERTSAYNYPMYELKSIPGGFIKKAVLDLGLNLVREVRNRFRLEIEKYRESEK